MLCATQDTISNAVSVPSGTAITWVHTCGAGVPINGCLVAWGIIASAADSVTSVTYNGIAPSVTVKVISVGIAAPTSIYLWKWDQPAAGAHNVTFNTNVGVFLDGAAISYTNAASGPLNAVTSGFVTVGQSLQLPITPTIPNCAIGMFSANNTVTTPSAGSGFKMLSAADGNAAITVYAPFAAMDPNETLLPSITTAPSSGAFVGFSFALAAFLQPGTGTVVTVGPSGRTFTTMQAAITAATDGTLILCDAGATFTESVTLPNKGDLKTGILITTNAGSGLPPLGHRTALSLASLMPAIQAPTGGSPAILASPGSNGYVFRHVNFLNTPLGFNDIVQLGAGDSTQQLYTDEPYFIAIDRCLIQGDPIAGQKRGVEVQGRYLTVRDSVFSNINSIGQDSQCVAGWNGHGPLSVINNEMNCGTYPFILGGADPTVTTQCTVTGAATTTSAVVTTQAGHTLAEFTVGQGITVTSGGVGFFTTITSVVGSGVTGTVNFVAIPTVPDTPGNVQGGVVLGMEGPGFGLLFRRNWCHNTQAWINGTLPAGTITSATPSTASGALAAGTYFYEVQAVSTNGYQGTTIFGSQTPEASATLSGTGQIALVWSAVAGATSYRIYRGTSSGAENVFYTSATNSFTDSGAVGTAGTPGGATQYQIKNLFELKAAQNVQIDSNVFQTCWLGVDIGFAMWLKSVNQNGNAAYVQSTNIVVEKNLWSSVDGAWLIHGREIGTGGFQQPGPLTNLTIRNNLIYDSGTPTWSQGSDHYAMQISEGCVNLTIDHNTVTHVTTLAGGGLIALDTAQLTPLLGLVLTNNMLRRETFGIHSPAGEGTVALNSVTSGGYTFLNNGIADAPASGYAGNFVEVASLWQGEFMNYVLSGVGADWRIKPSSAYHQAGTDNLDLGCNVGAVLAATANTITVQPPPVGRSHTASSLSAFY